MIELGGEVITSKWFVPQGWTRRRTAHKRTMKPGVTEASNLAVLDLRKRERFSTDVRPDAGKRTADTEDGVRLAGGGTRGKVQRAGVVKVDPVRQRLVASQQIWIDRLERFPVGLDFAARIVEGGYAIASQEFEDRPQA